MTSTSHSIKHMIAVQDEAHKKNLDSADPIPYDYMDDVYKKGLQYEKPPLTFQTTEWEKIAKDVLSADAYGYVYGSAGTRETSDNNRAAFKDWAILPRRLVKAGFPDLKTTIFGEELPYPIAVAPVGVLKIFHREGESAVARAAAKERIPYILSTASSTSIEEVAEASGVGQRWYQLYWPESPKNDDITISLLSRAKKAGFTALFVTLDTYILGWRPSDMDNGYNPFLRADSIGVELGFSDPVFRKRFEKEHGKTIEEDIATATKEWTKVAFPSFSHGWEDIAFLKKHWDGPIVLKGIQTVEDALKCVEVGVEGIVVSNHGGRQQDGGIASLSVLPEIVEAVGDKLEIIYDSGIRCGSDVVKALALGAKMVLIGRPFVYGLALAGEEGVRHVLRTILGDADMTLHLSGIPSVQKDVLNPSVLRKVNYQK